MPLKFFHCVTNYTENSIKKAHQMYRTKKIKMKPLTLSTFIEITTMIKHPYDVN